MSHMALLQFHSLRQIRSCIAGPRFLHTFKKPAHLSTTDQQTVLRLCNNGSEEDISKLTSLTKNCFNSFMQHRNRNGNYQSLQSVLHVEGIGIKTLTQMCAEILDKKTDDINLPFQNKSQKSFFIEKMFIHPKLSCDEPPEIVSFCMQPTTVFWTSMNPDLTVTDIQFMHFMDRAHMKYDHALYQEKVNSIVEKIPQADVYLMQDSPIIVTSAATGAGGLNKARIEATLMTLLNFRQPNPSPIQHRVYKIKRSVVSDHFHLNVGGEWVSSHNQMKQIFHGHCEEAVGVHIPQPVMQQYWDVKENTSVIREGMAQTLLQAITFFKLLYRNIHYQYPPTG